MYIKISKTDGAHAFLDRGWQVPICLGIRNYGLVHESGDQPVPFSVFEKLQFHLTLKEYWDRKSEQALNGQAVTSITWHHARLDNNWVVCLKAGADKYKLSRDGEEIPMPPRWIKVFERMAKEYWAARTKTAALKPLRLLPPSAKALVPHASPQPGKAGWWARRKTLDALTTRLHKQLDRRLGAPTPETVYARYVRALYNNHPRALGYAIERGAHPDNVVEIGDYKGSGVGYSALAVNKEALRELMRRDAQRVNPLDGEVPVLHKAIRLHQTSVVQILTHEGKTCLDRNPVWDDVLETGHDLAAGIGHHEIARGLSAIIDARDVYNGTGKEWRRLEAEAVDKAAQPQRLITGRIGPPFDAAAARAEEGLDIHIEEDLGPDFAAGNDNADLPSASARAAIKLRR